MKEALVAIAMTIWAAVHPQLPKAPDAERIADACAQSVLDDQAAGLPPIGRDYEEDLAVEAYWSSRESSLRARAVGDGGKAFGAFQLHTECGKRSLAEQARCWRAMVREGAKRCGAGSASYAILWGGCRLDLGPYGSPGWTSDRAAARRVGNAMKLHAGIAPDPPGP